MEIDFSTVLKDIRGKALKETPEQGQEPEDLTLGAVSVGALLTQDQGSDGKEKFKRWGLATKIQAGLEDSGLVDLDVGEVAKIRTLIGKIYAPIVVGQAWGLLDNKK